MLQINPSNNNTDNEKMRYDEVFGNISYISILKLTISNLHNLPIYPQ